MEENIIHHRRSIRLKGYDYNFPGAYFVTIVSFQRDEIFGKIADGRVELSPIGRIIQTEWFRSTEIRKEIRLFEDEFVIMPNHIHGIVWIVERNDVGANGVGANGVRPMDGIHPTIDGTPHPGTHRVPLRMVPRSLSSFIAGFKAVVSSRVGRELNSGNIWQRNYYEHIIRNNTEFENIWNYIDSNPSHWEKDLENPLFLGT